MTDEVKKPMTVAEAIAHREAEVKELNFRQALTGLTHTAGRIAAKLTDAEEKATKFAKQATALAVLNKNVLALTTEQTTLEYSNAADYAIGMVTSGYELTYQTAIDNYGPDLGALVAELLELSAPTA